MSTLFSQLKVKELVYDSEIQKILRCTGEETGYIVHAIFIDLEETFLSALIKDGFEYTVEEGVSYLIHEEGRDMSLEQAVFLGKITAEHTDKLFLEYKSRIKNNKEQSYNVIANLVNPENLAVSKTGMLKIFSEFKLPNVKREMYLSEVLHMIGEFMTMIYLKNPIISEKMDPISPMIKEIASSCLQSEYISLEQWIDKTAQIILLNETDVFETEQESKNFLLPMNQIKPLVLAILALLVLVLLIVGIKTLFGGKEEPKPTSLQLEEIQGATNSPVTGNTDENSETSVNETVSTEEGVQSYYSDKMKTSDGAVAQIDNETVYKGTSSLYYKVGEEEEEIFFADINFEDEKYQELKGKDVILSFWTSTTKEQSVETIVKIYEKGQLVGKTQKGGFITAGTWGENQLTVRLGTGDRIEVFIKAGTNSELWVDEIELKTAE